MSAQQLMYRREHRQVRRKPDGGVVNDGSEAAGYPARANVAADTKKIAAQTATLTASARSAA